MKVLFWLLRICSVSLFCLLLSILCCRAASGSTEARIIDRHGAQIPTVFFGISPNPRVAPQYGFRRTSGTSAGSCSVLKAIYRESTGLGTLLHVQDYCPDYAHHQVQTTRECLSCGGGYENWTYSDSEMATYCDGYVIDNMGSAYSCREDSWCYNQSSPGCY